MKEIITKILGNKTLTMEELTEFIEKYIEHKKGKPPTGEQIMHIVKLLQNGMFDVLYAADQYARDLGLTVVRVVEIKTMRTLRTDVYEKMDNTLQ